MPAPIGTILPTGETEESLHTPLPMPVMDPDDAPTFATPSLTTTCGLFDIAQPLHLLDADKDPLMSTQLTTAVEAASAEEEAGSRTLALESLDPVELESLLQDLADTPAATQPGLDSDDLVVPEDGHTDHDYCEDWAVLSEFIELTKPCLERNDSTIRVVAQSLEGSLGNTDTVSDFLETNLDVGALLLASIPVAKPQEAASPAPSDASSSGVQVKDGRYWARRRKNNVASAESRRTRKQKRVSLEGEREQLQKHHGDLVADVARLESLAKEWKQRLLNLIG